MKKLMILVMMASVFMALATTSFAQVLEKTTDVSVQDAKSVFDTTPGVITPGKRESKAEAYRPVSASGEFGPGDQAIFLPHVNRLYARPGENIDIGLVSMINDPRIVQISGRVYKPGVDGQYDGTERIGYFWAETGFNGEQRGLRAGEYIKAYRRTFNQEDLKGRYMIDFVATDSQGNLLQQIWLSVYLIDTGLYPPQFFVRDVKLQPQFLALTGRFPTGTPIYYMVGVPKWGFVITGPDSRYAAYATDNGKKVSLPARTIFRRYTSVDIMMWSPIYREAVMAPNAYVEESSF